MVYHPLWQPKHKAQVRFGSNILPADSAATSLPTTVTRFYGNVEYALETLRKKPIAFIHNQRMNDPFDPYFFVETEFTNRTEFLKWVLQHHPTKHRLIKENVSYEGFNAGFKWVKDNFEEHRRSTYLFSTSAENDGMHPKNNLYLWGHYGWGHRGIALEFNAANLACNVLAQSDPESRLKLTASDMWVKVDYKTRVAPLSHEAYLDFILSGQPADNHHESPGMVGVMNFLEQTFKTKHTVWRMENEWRLLWSNNSGNDVYHCPIHEDSLAGIYLGMRIDGTVKENVLSTVRSRMPGVPIAQAVKAEGNLALKWSRIA